MTVTELIRLLEGLPGHLHVVGNAGPVRRAEFQPVKGWKTGEKERGIVVLKSAAEVFRSEADGISEFLHKPASFQELLFPRGR